MGKPTFGESLAVFGVVLEQIQENVINIDKNKKKLRPTNEPLVGGWVIQSYTHSNYCVNVCCFSWPAKNHDLESGCKSNTCSRLKITLFPSSSWHPKTARFCCASVRGMMSLGDIPQAGTPGWAIHWGHGRSSELGGLHNSFLWLFFFLIPTQKTGCGTWKSCKVLPPAGVWDVETHGKSHQKSCSYL